MGSVNEKERMRELLLEVMDFFENWIEEASLVLDLEEGVLD